ncbi:hypothetical protein H4W31_007662 [Plantactinospora soyae]|uniref:Uncharacterized protein n=1 Tax=Plantactinospora soyae TaxID=1544732 RepID=A0A927MCN3_9ACTN|nr:hypothetical protein [Plantactinospora soyae]
MFLIRWYLREAWLWLRTRHGPVWSHLHAGVVCRCGETCKQLKRRNDPWSR